MATFHLDNEDYDLYSAEIIITTDSGIIEPSDPKSRQPQRVPLVEFHLKMRADARKTLGEWAKASEDQKRFRDCKVVVYHQAKQSGTRQVLHTWEMKNAFVRRYHEMEFPTEVTPGGTDTQMNFQGELITLVLQGYKPDVTAYTSDEIVTVN